MKILLFVLLLCIGSNASASVSAINDTVDSLRTYSGAIKKIEKFYAKQQLDYSGRILTHVLIPVSMFPFLCMPDSITKNLQRGQLVWMNSFELNMRKRVDKSNEYLQIATVSYVGLPNGHPDFKTYRLFFFVKNVAMGDWEETRDPLVVILDLTSKLEVTYGCH